MVSTIVGYTGGTTEDPTYYHLGDHSESVEVTYDPAKISYTQLVDVFLAAHEASMPTLRQYRSAIFVRTAAERRIAEQELAADKHHSATSVEVDGAFWPAEDYHQKFNLRTNSVLMADFRAMYPDDAAFERSTAAARVNGWLGGKVPMVDVASLGLSSNAAKELVDRPSW